MLFCHVVITVCACTFVTCTLIKINQSINLTMRSSRDENFRLSLTTANAQCLHVLYVIWAACKMCFFQGSHHRCRKILKSPEIWCFHCSDHESPEFPSRFWEVLEKNFNWPLRLHSRAFTYFLLIMPRPLGGGIKRWCCLTSVCLTSVCRVHRA